jgi:uncharacterized membrane protein YfcA
MVDTPWLYPALFASGLVAGWIDSIAGGGGLVTIPVLLGFGLSPQVALGTNKFQASFGSFTAAANYVREGVVDLPDARVGIAWTLVGSAAGTWSVQQIRSDFLNLLIPVLLIAIALYMLFVPAPGQQGGRARMGKGIFYFLFGISLGFYDGFFGPGVGSFWAFALIAGLGFSLTRATGYTKVMNFTSNIVSFVLFLLGGFVLVLPGVVMAAGQIIGARIGSGMVVKRGARFIRPIFILVVILTTVKLLIQRIS